MSGVRAGQADPTPLIVWDVVVVGGQRLRTGARDASSAIPLGTAVGQKASPLGEAKRHRSRVAFDAIVFGREVVSSSTKRLRVR